jgi:methylase of polypeptide subunit release factors
MQFERGAPSPEQHTKRGKTMIKNDFVQTPKEITEALLKLEKFEGSILEPCCGKGAISEVLKSEGYEVISSDKFSYGYGEEKDLFEVEEEFDNIITNPPFTQQQKVKKHLLNLAKKKVCLLWYVKNLGNEIETKTSKNLKYVYVFNKRIDWVETKLGWLFAWYVWEKGYEGDVIIKRIDWEQPIAQSQNSPSAFSNEKDLIGIKRVSAETPNLSKAQTSLNSDIKRNFSFGLQEVYK